VSEVCSEESMVSSLSASCQPFAVLFLSMGSSEAEAQTQEELDVAREFSHSTVANKPRQTREVLTSCFSDSDAHTQQMAEGDALIRTALETTMRKYKSTFQHTVAEWPALKPPRLSPD
jgi:hypothetical protein